MAAADRLTNRRNRTNCVLTGLPNAWIGLLVAAFEEVSFRNPFKTISRVRSRG